MLEAKDGVRIKEGVLVGEGGAVNSDAEFSVRDEISAGMAIGGMEFPEPAPKEPGPTTASSLSPGAIVGAMSTARLASSEANRAVPPSNAQAPNIHSERLLTRLATKGRIV
jgi:hypothetical protein